MPEGSPKLHIETLGLRVPGVEPASAEQLVADVGARLASREVLPVGPVARLDVRVDAPESPDGLADAIADGIVRALGRRER